MLALQQQLQRAARAAAPCAPSSSSSSCASLLLLLPTRSTAQHRRPYARAPAQPKGFGGAPTSPPDAAPPSTSTSAAPAAKGARRDDDAALEALEARLKSRRAAAANLVPKVKVESAAVKLGTGQAPGEAGGAAETLYVQFLGALFVLILVEGLVLAASGFLPEAADDAVATYLYPTYSPQILLFLGMSSLYGLFKTGKLPGQKQL